MTLGTGANNAQTFIVCTQYFSKYTVSVADGTIASATVTQSVAVNDQINKATVTITGLKSGSTTVKITDKKGNFVTVSITVPGPLTLTCPDMSSVAGPGVSPAQCSVASNPGYSGSYQIENTTSNTCTATMTDATVGTFTVSDTSPEACTVSVQPSPANGETGSYTINFSGPLSLQNCPAQEPTDANAQCTINDPNYTGSFNASPPPSSGSGHCQAAITNHTLSVSDATSEVCSFTVSTPLGSASANVQFTTGNLEITQPGNLKYVQTNDGIDTYSDDAGGSSEISPSSFPFTVTNNGPTASQTLTLTTGGGAFSLTQDTCTGKVLSPGQSCTFTLYLNPGDFGTYSTDVFVAPPGYPGSATAYIDVKFTFALVPCGH
jgi:hypothetical protein